MAPATELLDELIEEIFFRIHPADATTLVCKRWCRIIADPGFRRRVCAALVCMLGFSSNIDLTTSTLPAHLLYGPQYDTPARFVRTSSCLKHVAMARSCVVDTRHGRILLLRTVDPGYGYLFVWDPLMKEEHKLPRLPLPGDLTSWNAAVFCAAAGCDHLDCHGKPFAVVVIATGKIAKFDVLFYSSEAAGSWTKETYRPFSQQHENPSLMLELEPSVLVGNVLYFLLRANAGILKYSMGTEEIHSIDLPSSARFLGLRVLLAAAEDGGLGFATVRRSKLYLWSTESGSEEKYERWVQERVIDLEKLLPIGALETPPHVVGFAYGVGLIFVKTDSGHFRIDLKSGWVKKVRSISGGSIIFPYMSFHTPALGAVATSAVEGPSMGASSA
ncbi:unnamed protein product [Urochloa decumbens]|uniref:F-box protein AT5G49610-like beta-propeller domain-containing protein n=1 Tax=Urochloa decumbens TaxID=240449 RepID=A0ABC9FL66_9POAL